MSMDNWKQFQGTELGSVLSKLYGNNSSSKINYPKPKSKVPFDSSKEIFRPVNSKPNATDPRKTTRKQVDLIVPKCNGSSNNENFHPVDYLMKRRNKSVIDVEIDDMKMRDRHYRPAHFKAISSDYEKEKLSQIFSCKGGKALPDELTNPVGDAPYELQERRQQAERMSNIRRSKGLKVDNGNTIIPAKTFSSNELLAQQIKDEINDRTEYLTNMRMMKGSIAKHDEARVKNEIKIRMHELDSLGKDLSM